MFPELRQAQKYQAHQRASPASAWRHPSSAPVQLPEPAPAPAAAGEGQEALHVGHQEKDPTPRLLPFLQGAASSRPGGLASGRWLGGTVGMPEARLLADHWTGRPRLHYGVWQA
mmetsp:Transcript_11986/g.34605  ORF Transcript_11986/g.34605 Transcript_11986/m.34605 type:complete len:114 (-) Transcript_11986:453-794(-)